MIERRTIRDKWADATRHMRAEEANQLWQELMVEWVKPIAIDQGYWDALLDRRMRVLERKAQRRTVSDDEWDNTHQDMGR